MAVHVIAPTCGDARHKRAGWTNRKAHPAVAVVRQRGYRGRWVLRCRDCVSEFRTINIDYDLAYLHNPAASQHHDPTRGGAPIDSS